LEKRIIKLQNRIEKKEDKIEELQAILDKAERSSNIFKKIEEFESTGIIDINNTINFNQPSITLPAKE
jgi:flagellar biosynthesis chaperone FliJ